MRRGVLLAIIGLFGAAALLAAEPASQGAKESPTKATYLISGLHCPPCAKIVESALLKTKGVRSAHVDWNSKNATVEFDEMVVSAQKLGQVIAHTPHMMGRNMKYDGWLALQVPDIKDDTTAKPVVETLSQVSGVAQVAAHPAHHAVSVRFSNDGALTSKQLIEILAKEGIKASNL